MLRLVCKAGKHDAEKVRKLADELGVSARTAQLLLDRGIESGEEAARFLNPSAAALENPFLLKDMDRACASIKEAIALGEKIVVFGDYDADGVCATSIMLSCLKRLGARAEYMIPSRHEDGYGMTMKSAEQLFNMGANLIITVDNGIKSVTEIARCYELGMRVIVTDHHIPGDTLPVCEALVLADNDDNYPNRHICGAGLAMKVAEALLGREAALEYIPLAGIATVADIVPLTGENRVIAALAVKAVRQGKCQQGIKALCEASKTRLSEISAGGFGFRIAPRLNAASRIEEADDAVELLSEKDTEKARNIAAKLEELNYRRKGEEDAILESACEKLKNEDLTKRRCIVLHDEGWNSGVVGIAAARIAEKYYRPTVLLSGKDTVSGSCRSISGVNIHSALLSCERFFSRFGGHAYAAGLTLKDKGSVNELWNALDEYFWQNESEEMFIPAVQYDFETELGGLTKRFAEELEMLEPFGAGNPQPVALSRSVRLTNIERMGADGKYVRCSVNKNDQYLPAVWFSVSANFKDIIKTDRVDLIYLPGINRFNGREELQLTIKGMRGAEPENTDAWAERQKGKFVDAICKNVLYNSTRVPEEISFTNAEEKLKELIQKSAMGTLALCFTVNGAKRLLTTLKKEGLWNRADVEFSCPAKSLCAYNAAILAPRLEELEISRYKNIVVMDTAPSAGIIDRLKKLCPAAEIYLNKPDRAEIAGVLDGVPTRREDFAPLYKALMLTTGRYYNLPAMADALTLASGAPGCVCALAASVFLELGFATKTAGGIRLEKNPPKRSLEESETFIALNSLEEMNDMYLQLYKEANHEA